MLPGTISAALTGTAWAGGLTSDADHGDALYESCQDCHSFDKNDIGPRQRWVWNEETLDKWLTDPQAVAPGAKMFFHLDNPQDRADVIAYLKKRAK